MSSRVSEVNMILKNKKRKPVMDKKELFLKEEGNAWFHRNKKIIDKMGEVAFEYNLVSEFLKGQHILGEQNSILEVGCSYGYNLAYLNSNLKTICYGIDPSLDAINYGKSKFCKPKYDVNLEQGTSDLLPYEDNKFNVVIMGFCLFWVDRKYLFKSIAEADRVLRLGGYVIIIDFDTSIPFKRDNIHNSEAYTYKMQYANLFLANPQYYLIEKKSYSHNTKLFNTDIQERISLCILYKNTEDNAYQKA